MPDEVNFEDQHPGFIITCKQCGSTNVVIDNSLGFSAESGSWGSIDLICQDCGNTTIIVDS